jgi:Neuraminidase-like domain
LNSVVSASSVGGVVTVKSLNAAPFTLTCGLSPGATETYIAGPEFPAWQAAVAGGFSAGDILTTTIDGIPIACPVIAGDTTATLAARIATVINGQTKTDPVTGLPLNRSVIVSSSGSSILLKAAGSTFTLHCTLSAGATEILTIGGMLPARAGDKPLASEWRGYLTVPQDGFYNIRVESDAGATVTLAIGGTAVTLVASANGSVWTNQSPIGLTSSALSAIALTATAVTDTLVVSWESTGLGWQVIPSANLYSDTLIRRLQASYVRFVKAASLATGLSLTSGEIAYLAADANYQINQQEWLNALAVWGNSDGATQLALRDILVAVLDFARLKSVFSPNDERLLKALQALMPAPGDTGTVLLAVTGWDALSLTRLVAQFGLFFGGGGVSALSDPRNLQRVYDAAIVLRVSGVSAAALIAATTNEPGVSTTDGKDHLAAGPNVFTPVSTANIAVGSALVIGAGAAKESVTVTAVTATTFSAVTVNPHNGTAMPFPIVGASDLVGAFQAAIRARYAEPDWITVITPINHVLREMQRDALVVYALQALARASQPVTVDNGTPVNTADTLFEYLLMDVQTGACMETSRIRHALSSVQLFAERAFLGLELNTDKSKNVDPALFKASEWVWMKRYRLWQANREVFLWPENWLYPELRDDQSPIFKDVIGKLLQKDISADGATDAYLQYLADLQKIAKLDPSGICYDPSTSDVHVVSRSMDGTQTYYYRKFIGGSWWPWEETGLKIEDNPVLPVLWNGRLLLFWLQLVQQNPAPSQTVGAGDAHDQSLVNGKFSDAAQFAGDVAASQPLSVAFNLCWSEYYNGKWQAAHISNAPCTLDNFPQTDNGGLDRPQLRLDSYAQSSPDPTRLILVASSTDHGGVKNFPGVCAFALYNTHSQPVAYPDSAALALQAPSPFDRAIIDFFGAGLFCQYRSGNTFNFEHFLFVIRNVPVQSGTIAPSYPVPAIYWWQNQDWTAPFFYSDTNNAFYVEADRSWPLISVVGTYGLATPSKMTSPDIPPTHPEERRAERKCQTALQPGRDPRQCRIYRSRGDDAVHLPGCLYCPWPRHRRSVSVRRPHAWSVRRTRGLSPSIRSLGGG